MSAAPDPIEAYVDELTDRLHGSPGHVRRTVTEAETHLRDAVDARIAAGLDRQAATASALAEFGAAADVAAAMNQALWRRNRLPLAREGLELGFRLVGVGMVVVGVAGLVARLLAGVTSVRTIFGLPSTAEVSSSSCAHWLALHPGAGSCRQAATLEASADQVLAMVLMGVVGALLLAGLAVVRRRRPHSRMLPAVLGPVIAATAFGGAALGLAVLGADNAVVLGTWGQGLWWTCAGCSAVAGLVSLLALARELPDVATAGR